MGSGIQKLIGGGDSQTHSIEVTEAYFYFFKRREIG
jgi:hypothetical protein